jgi:hypothetical protein
MCDEKGDFELSIFTERPKARPSGKHYYENGISFPNKNQHYVDSMFRLLSMLEPHDFGMRKTFSRKKITNFLVNLMEIGFVTINLSYGQLTALKAPEFPSIFRKEVIIGGQTRTRVDHHYYYTTLDAIKKVERSEISKIRTFKHPSIEYLYREPRTCIIL